VQVDANGYTVLVEFLNPQHVATAWVGTAMGCASSLWVDVGSHGCYKLFLQAELRSFPVGGGCGG